MVLFKKKTQNQEQGEKILKQTVGTKGMKNGAMYKKISPELGYRKTHKLLDNVIKEVKTELEQDMITADEVEDRVYTLIEYELGHPLNDANQVVELKSEYIIEIPYSSSGIHGYTRVSNNVVMGTNMGEGITQWRSTKMFIREYGVEIKHTGQQIRFSDITDVRSGDDGGLLIKTTKLVLFLVNGEQFVMKVMTSDVDGLVGLFQDHINSDGSGDGVSNVDELMKYADLFERGLLSQEEFDEIKKRLL